MKWVRRWTEYFVVWVMLFALAAYVWPFVFVPLKPWIVTGLGVIMFGMGMTLLPADFARVARMPRAVVCGLLGQFLLMPFLAVLLVRLGGFPPELSMGFILLGCCPGGTASNVIAFLAKADVALSVSMTACSTVAAVVMTPLLVWLLGGTILPVDAWDLLGSVLKVVLVPVALGVGVRQALGERVERGAPVFAALSVGIIVLVIAAIIASAAEQLPGVIGKVGIFVVLHNVLGYASGYGFAALFGLSEQARRTVAIEVGMQNSGLGVALAAAHFQSALTALPASLFSVVHNLTGSMLAAWWSRRGAGSDQPPSGAGPRSEAPNSSR
ncbi:MAG: bile acid:sodium symporter family protein [Candidatus Hydrogenedentes bacterium]|nr:bile acid:sodium symporter family protein [Candidatus Hydrogenedentota bacterium]